MTIFVFIGGCMVGACVGAIAIALFASRRIAELVEALQTLCDLQNGPPIVRHADEWHSAMEAARVAIWNAAGGDE